MPRVRKIATMSELQAALQSAFNAINRDYYGGELEKAVITVKEGKNKNAFGWIELAKNWNQNGTKRHEINIAGDYLGERTVRQTITTLMHEMVHLYNIQNGIKDTTRSGIYHNKNFKKTAEEHGLEVEQVNQIGWCRTTPTPETAKWIDENIPIKSFGIFKQVATKDPATGNDKKKQSYRKYICPECGLIVRATKDCRIACIECKKEMRIES